MPSANTRTLSQTIRSFRRHCSWRLRHRFATWGTMGGNLLQRPRSLTYRNPDPKRHDGPSRFDAIFGLTPLSRAPHPSDLAVALMAMDATIRVQGVNGTPERLVKMADFYHIPDHSLKFDTLAPGDLITAIEGAGAFCAPIGLRKDSRPGVLSICCRFRCRAARFAGRHRSRSAHSRRRGRHHSLAFSRRLKPHLRVSPRRKKVSSWHSRTWAKALSPILRMLSRLNC